MTPQKPSSDKDRKKARLAQALKANLQRRKAPVRLAASASSEKKKP